MPSQSTGAAARKRGAASGCRGRTKVAAKPSMTFAALAENSDDSDLSDSETANKMAPSDVVLESSHDFVASESEFLDADWAPVERRRKPEAAKVKELRGVASQVASTTSRSCAASSMVGDDDADAIDADWFLRKGQRHGWSKRQKQEWNFKAKLRVDYAKQKRDGQRSAVLG